MMAPKPRWRGVLDRHSHNTVIGTLVLFICAASGIIFWLSFQHVAQIYLAETERTLGEIQGFSADQRGERGAGNRPSEGSGGEALAGDNC